MERESMRDVQRKKNGREENTWKRNKRKENIEIRAILWPVLWAVVLWAAGLSGCSWRMLPEGSETGSWQTQAAEPDSSGEQTQTADSSAALHQDITFATEAGTLTVPGFVRYAYTVVNGNIPFFNEGDGTAEAFETYSDLDELGRCGAAFACIGEELMPTEERGDISAVKPTGWQTSRYDFIEGELLYNRCHLIGYQLTGENANEKNLITGTRYMNVEGMEPFESRVASYVKSTGNHVWYRVTPVYTGDHLLADGVLMEARSVEDDGQGVQFCVFVYNVQPGVGIDYETGENWLLEQEAGETEEFSFTYVLNTRSMKFHLPACESVSAMSEHNKQEFTGTREELIAQGYTPCGNCKP